MAVASEKVRFPPTILYMCPKWLLLHKKVFGKFRQLRFTFMYLPVLWGRELLTCLNHTNPVHRKRSIMSLLLGYCLGLFCIFPDSRLKRETNV